MNNKEKQQPQPASTSQPKRGGFSITNNPLTRGASRAYDQVNMFDNGRTWKQTEALRPTGDSVIHQASHNALTNTVGNFVAKPFFINPAQNVIETGRAITAEATGNQNAFNASRARQWRNVQESLPGQIVSNVYNIGKANTVDLGRQALADITGNKEAYKNATDAYFNDINRSAVGQLVNIPERQAIKYQTNRDAPWLDDNQVKQVTGERLANIGVDPDANMKNQLLSTAGGALTLAAPTFGLAKAGVEGTPFASFTQPSYLSGATFLDMAKQGKNAVTRGPSEPVAPTTKLVINNPENAKIAPLPINNPDAARVGGLEINNPGGASIKPTTKLLKVRNPDNAKIAPQPLSGAAQQSNLAKNRFGITKLNEIGAIGKDVRPKSEQPITLFRSGDVDPKNKRGIFLSNDKATAENYQSTGLGNKTTHEYKLSKNAKMYEAENTTRLLKELRPDIDKNNIIDRYIKQQVREGKLIDGLTAEQRADARVESIIKQELTKKGYDGVSYSGGKWDDAAGEYQLFNDKHLERVSKLTPDDIQNELEYAIDMFPDKVGRDFKPDEYMKVQKNLLDGKSPYDGIESNRKSLFKPLNEIGAVGRNVNNDLPITGVPLPKPKSSKFAKGVTRSSEISPELQAKVKAAKTSYVPIQNSDMVQASKTLVNKGYKKAATEVTSRLEKKLGRIDGQDVADTIHVIKKLDAKGGEANLQQATLLSEKLSQHLTKAGQTVQAASLLNNRTPEGMMYGARKFLKSHGVEVTPEIQKALKGKVDEIAKMKPGEERLYKIAELQQEVSKYIPSSNLDKAVGLWKAGLLTGVKTQTGNMLSGVATNVIKTASDVPAALLDEGFTALGKTKVGKKLGFTGEHSKSFTLRGKGSGAVEGGKKGWNSLKTGVDERNLEAVKFDTKRLVFSKSKAGRLAQRYTDGVYGLMGAADRPNYYSNLRNNLYDLAITDAKNKGLKGVKREAHVTKFVKEPPMSALETATKAAETSIFANDTALSRIAGGILKKADDSGPVVGAAAKVVLPFTKVPSAVATRLVDYSPLGAVKTVAEQIKNVKKGGGIDQRALSEGLAQSSVGTGTMYLGMKLREADLMTGSYPDDPKERELWKLEGKQENSIKVGGKWLSFNYTSPVGQILAVGGKIADSKKGGGSTSEQLIAGIGAIPNTVTQQSFLQGVQGVQDAIADPEKRGYKFVKSQASSVVPTLLSDSAKATDPYQRQSSNIKEAVQAKIPGLSKQLLPKQDPFGNPLERQSSALDQLINPFRPSKIKPADSLTTELRRLQDAKYGVMPNSTDKQLEFGSKKDGSKQTINLTPKQLYDKNNQVGQIVQKKWNEIISTPEYAKMSNYEKQQALGNVLEDANALGKAQYAADNQPALLDEQKLTKRQVNLATQDDNAQYLKTTAGKEKTSYEYTKASSQRSLDMSRASANNDLGSYQKVAMSELDALEKLKNSYDPDTEQDKINTTIKKQESLARKLQGYLDKGYIKKGKTGKKSGGKKKGTKINYAKQLSAINGSSNTKALRALVKRSKITRRKI